MIATNGRTGSVILPLIIPSKDLSKLDDADEPYEDIVLLNELEEDPVPPSIPEIRRSISPFKNTLIRSDAEQVKNDLLDR